MELCRLPKRIIAFAIAISLALCLFAQSNPASAQTFSEYDLLLLDFELNKQAIAESVTAYQYNNDIVISLAETGAALGFPISVDAGNGIASGWFISKDRVFELDIDAATVTVGGDTAALSPGDAITFGHAIYVTLDAFSRWFPVTLTAQLSSMTIDVQAEETLLVQLRAHRSELLGQQMASLESMLPAIAQPYRLLGSHTADTSLGYSVRRETTADGMSSPDTSFTHSSLIRGDLAYMTSAIYLSGNNDVPLGYARMTLSRTAPDTPLGINLIELGDIIPSAIIGTPQVGIERGLRINGSTAKNTDSDHYDANKTRITGDIQQGWEVELLHEAIRIDYQIIGLEGRYDFRDLNLYVGKNTFELIFYGPAGEQYSEIITRYSGVNAINKGVLNYEFSASQKATPLFNSKLVIDESISNKGSEHYTASVGYGLSSNLSINSTWNSSLVGNERLDYYSLGVRAGLGILYITLDATIDPLGGTIWNGVVNVPAQKHLWGFNAQFEHTQYADSVLATDATYDLQINSLSRLTLTGNIKTIATRWSVAQRQLADKTSTLYTTDLSKTIGLSRFGNTLNYQTVDDPEQAERYKQVNGNLYFNAKLDSLSIRGNVSYQLEPSSKTEAYNLDLNLPISIKMNLNFGLDHSPKIKLTEYNAAANWQLKYLTLSPKITYDSNERYTGFIFLTMSFGPRPDRPGVLIRGQARANSGGVAARTFLDHNNNGVFDPSDKALPNIDINATQAFQRATTDEHGVAYLSKLKTNKVTDIRIHSASLSERGLHSNNPGNSVQPRPAYWAVIDFPIVKTGEIGGYLYQQNALARIPKPGTVVELWDQDNQLVEFSVSDHDGFFLFEDIPYGTYTVTLAETHRSRLTQLAPTVILHQNNTTQFGVELTMTPLITRPINGSVLVLEEASISPVVSDIESLAVIRSPDVAEKQAPTIVIPQPRASNNFYAVQLASFKDRVTANEATMILRNKFTEQFRGLRLKIKAFDLGAKGLFFRVYALGDMTEEDAGMLCQVLKQSQQSCLIAKESITQ